MDASDQATTMGSNANEQWTQFSKMLPPIAVTTNCSRTLRFEPNRSIETALGTTTAIVVAQNSM
jgi:hypothetical protein